MEPDKLTPAPSSSTRSSARVPGWAPAKGYANGMIARGRLGGFLAGFAFVLQFYSFGKQRLYHGRVGRGSAPCFHGASSHFGEGKGLVMQKLLRL